MAKQKRPAKGTLLTVEGRALDFRGRGIARVVAPEALDGYEALLTDLFPGEFAAAEITHVSKHGRRLFAEVKSHEQTHDERRTPPCENHIDAGGRCTGCPLMALSPKAQREAKRDALRDLGLPVQSVEAPDEQAEAGLGYRWSSKRIAFRQVGEVRLGSYIRGTHAHAPMPGCLVEHPLITEAADTLVAVAREEVTIPIFGEAPHGLRYVWFKTNGQRVVVTLIAGSPNAPWAKRLATMMQRRLPERLGVAFAHQGDDGNAIRGEAPRALCGDPELRLDILGETRIAGPLGFLQPNPIAAAMAYDALVDHQCPETQRALAWDLYAGAGITTARLSRDFAKVVPVEAFEESARDLGVEPMTAEAFLSSQSERPDAIIANPPRAGMGQAVCDALGRLAQASAADGAPMVLKIMSCHPESLNRDLERLRQHFTVESVRAFDTLPHTPHVELVASLRAIA